MNNNYKNAPANHPLVSVIINCFNGEKYLREAIDSVLTQKYKNWEIIFWDNQSTDSSAEIVKSYVDPRIHYFYAPKHTVLYEARNYAIKKSSGDLLAFLDVDDTWSKNKLQSQVVLFDDDLIGFAASNYLIRNQRGKWYYFNIGVKEKKNSGFVLDELLENYYVGLLTLMVRRKAYDQQDNGFDHRFNIIGDFDLVVRLAQKWKMGWLDSPLATYRWHENNLSQASRLKSIEELDVWIQGFSLDSSVIKSPKFNLFYQNFIYRKLIAYKLCDKQFDLWVCLKTLSFWSLKSKAFLIIILPALIFEIYFELKWKVSYLRHKLPELLNNS